MSDSMIVVELTELEIELVTGGAEGDTPDYVTDGSTTERNRLRAF